MKKSDSQLMAERLGVENAALLLQVVDSILRKIDPALATEPDPERPVQVASANVRLAMSCLTAALTGEETPSSLFNYLARSFEGQALACKKYEDELDQKSNGNGGFVN